MRVIRKDSQEEMEVPVEYYEAYKKDFTVVEEGPEEILVEELEEVAVLDHGADDGDNHIKPKDFSKKGVYPNSKGVKKK